MASRSSTECSLTCGACAAERSTSVVAQEVHGSIRPPGAFTLAMDEYKDEFQRGDFLIRNLTAIDRERRFISIGAVPRVGQTFQFQLRDPEAADSELIELLERAKRELKGREPIGALLCACNGRGVGLFGTPSHDARAISEHFGPLPLVGFFCNGEFGPVGGKPFVHGFTASLAVIVPL